MESFECGSEAFVVSCETTEACGPGERSFNDPAAGQKHEASFRHRVFDDLQSHAVLFSGGSSVWSGVTLIHLCHLDRAASHLLHLLGQRGHLFAVSLGSLHQTSKIVR